MTRFIRNVIIATLLVCCFHSSGLALTNEEVFSQFQFNFITPGARATALGGAFIGLADDATAVESNPAGLTQLSEPEVSTEVKYITYTTKQFFENPYSTTDIRWEEFDNSVTGVSFVSAVYPYKQFVFSVYRQELVNYESSFKTSGSYTFVPGYDLYGVPVDTSVELNVTNYGIGASVQLREGLSVAVSPRWSLMNIKSYYANFHSLTNFSEGDIFYESEIDDNDSGFSVNAGIMWSPYSMISIGAVYRKGTKFGVAERIHSQHFSDENFEDYIQDFTLKVPDSFGIGIAIQPIGFLTVVIDVVHIRYKDLLEGFVPLLPGPSDFDATGEIEYKEENFTMDNVTELHFGIEYILSLGKRLLALRAGVYNEPDHTLRYTGTTGNERADAFQRAWFPGGEDDFHITGGVGLVFNDHFQIDAAANIADKNTQVSLSTVYRF